MHSEAAGIPMRYLRFLFYITISIGEISQLWRRRRSAPDRSIFNPLVIEIFANCRVQVIARFTASTTFDSY
jgi:hypothetical protein